LSRLGLCGLPVPWACSAQIPGPRWRPLRLSNSRSPSPQCMDRVGASARSERFQLPDPEAYGVSSPAPPSAGSCRSGSPTSREMGHSPSVGDSMPFQKLPGVVADSAEFRVWRGSRSGARREIVGGDNDQTESSKPRFGHRARIRSRIGHESWERARVGRVDDRGGARDSSPRRSSDTTTVPMSRCWWSWTT